MDKLKGHRFHNSMFMTLDHMETKTTTYQMQEAQYFRPELHVVVSPCTLHVTYCFIYIVHVRNSCTVHCNYNAIICGHLLRAKYTEFCTQTCFESAFILQLAFQGWLLYI